MHGSDYDCSNGRFVTEGDNVDDSGDECFTLMVMIITIVVLVAHPSAGDYHPQESVFVVRSNAFLLLHALAPKMHHLRALA